MILPVTGSRVRRLAVIFTTTATIIFSITNLRAAARRSRSHPLCAVSDHQGQSLRRKIIRDLTGQTFLETAQEPVCQGVWVSDIRARAGARTEASLRARRSIPFLITNAVLLAGLSTFAGYWWAFFVLWLSADGDLEHDDHAAEEYRRTCCRSRSQ